MFGKVFGKSLRGWALVAFVGVAAAACSSHQPRRTTWLRDSERNMVTIRNDNWLDADVFVYRLGSRYRIGTAPVLGSTTFFLPRNLVQNGTVRLLVDPIGSLAIYTSDQIHVSPGQRIELRVASKISMSSFAVWNR